MKKYEIFIVSQPKRIRSRESRENIEPTQYVKTAKFCTCTNLSLLLILLALSVISILICQVYLILWFWFFTLLFITGLQLLLRLATIAVPPLRLGLLILKTRSYNSDDVATLR